MKALILDNISKAELLAMLRGTSKAADKTFNDEAGDVIEGLSGALRQLAADQDIELDQQVELHAVDATAMLEEACEAAGFPTALPLFLHDLRLLMDMVEGNNAAEAWIKGRGAHVVDIILGKRRRDK